MNAKASTIALDTALALEANASDVIISLGLKANTADVYTKTQTDSRFAPKESPTFTGAATRNSLAATDDVTGIKNQLFS